MLTAPVSSPKTPYMDLRGPTSKGREREGELEGRKWQGIGEGGEWNGKEK